MKEPRAPFLLVLLPLLLTFAALALDTIDASDPRPPLIAAAITGACGVAFGSLRSKSELGYIDIFHPLIFPLAYISVSFLAPAWAMMVNGQSFTIFTPTDIAPHTAWVLAVAVLGSTIGLGINFNRRNNPGPTPHMASAYVFWGRALLILPMALSVRDVATGSIATRGLGQTTYTAESFISTIAVIFIPLGILLIANGHRGMGLPGMLARTDWCLIALFIALIGLEGNRGNAISIIIGLLYVYTRKKFRLGAVLATGGAILVFAAAVAGYRLEARGESSGSSSTEAILTDLSVVTYTTGLTAAHIPSNTPYYFGETYVTSLIRQLPSPIANRLLGPPYDTASYIFRDLINFDNPNLGLAYSLPAEGYLNFGIAGAFASCLLFGAGLSWGHSRSTWPCATAFSALYPLTIMLLPLLLRSDALGSMKLVLYPLIAAFTVFLYARSRTTSGAGSKLLET